MKSHPDPGWLFYDNNFKIYFSENSIFSLSKFFFKGIQ